MKTIVAPKSFRKSFWALSRGCVHRFNSEKERDAFIAKHGGEALLSTGSLIRKIRGLGIKEFPLKIKGGK